jgi:hypothetical protein
METKIETTDSPDRHYPKRKIEGKRNNPPPPGIEPETFRLQDSYEELLTAERATNCATED